MYSAPALTYTCSCLVTEAKQGVEWEEDTHQTTNTSLASARNSYMTHELA